MTPERDRLDAIIDRTAAGLVSVEPDDRMADRIVDRLPERQSPATRFVLGWLPHMAAAAAVLVAIVIWNRGSEAPVGAPHVAMAPPVATAPPNVAPSDASPAPAVVPTPVVTTARRARAGAAAPAQTGDFERSLAFVADPGPLTLPSITATSLEEEAALVVAPLVLTELPLSGGSDSPR